MNRVEKPVTYGDELAFKVIESALEKGDYETIAERMSNQLYLLHAIKNVSKAGDQAIEMLSKLMEDNVLPNIFRFSCGYRIF